MNEPDNTHQPLRFAYGDVLIECDEPTDPDVASWRRGFVQAADGQPILGSYSEHRRPDGSTRIQALYKRKDGSFAEL
jgi:hypothetical protein